ERLHAEARLLDGDLGNERSRVSVPSGSRRVRLHRRAGSSLRTWPGNEEWRHRSPPHSRRATTPRARGAMIGGLEFWWDSAPELIERERAGWDGPGPLGPFRGVTTNPMLLLAACEHLPSRGRRRGDGWDLYLACASRSAEY